MKAISIHQPWADLIVDGKRRLEIRKWTTRHRGILLIHATLTVDWPECGRLDVVPSAKGAIIGLAKLVSIHKLTEQEWDTLRSLHLEVGARPYGDNTFGWFLKSAFRFKQAVPFRGALGLFSVPDELIPKRTWKILKGGKVIESIIPGRYAGYKIDKIFGRLDCASCMRMKKENRVFFISWEDAIAEGYRPCKNCKPTPSN
jgi:hypothetical protein